MATRKVKDAKDLSTDELIYFKGHAKATYMSDGTTVEDAIPTKVSQLTNDSGYVKDTDLLPLNIDFIDVDEALETGLYFTNSGACFVKKTSDIQSEEGYKLNFIEQTLYAENVNNGGHRISKRLLYVINEEIYSYSSWEDVSNSSYVLPKACRHCTVEYDGTTITARVKDKSAPYGFSDVKYKDIHIQCPSYIEFNTIYVITQWGVFQVNGLTYDAIFDPIAGSDTEENKTDEVLTTLQYYDDGSSEVVPIKHPDISTQPNILPYKLAGNYVYEQLISIPNDIKFSTSNGYIKFSIDAPKWEIEKPSVLKATLMSSNVASVNESQMCMPCIVSNAGDSLSVYVSDVLLAEKESLKDLWLLLEYSSFDARGGYYYERSNEVVAEKEPTESKYNLYINVEDGYTWTITGKQYNTGLHKLSDEDVTYIITTSDIFGGIVSTLDDTYAYMKATLEGYTETRNAGVPWMKIGNGIWSCPLVYFYDIYSGVYSLSYHLPMAAEAIAKGEKVILELTNTY